MTADVPSTDDESAVRKVAVTSLAGTSIEFYDFFLYGTAAALVFPRFFFAADMPALVALLASFSTFAVGFLARPLGGIVFGHFGDSHGRKRALVASLVLMGASTTLIGLLPGYETWGWLAPLSLVLLRFVQGLALGGQWAGAVLLATETAPAHRRGYYGSFAQAGAPVGVVLANLAFLLVTSLLPNEAFLSWGWRIPFVTSVVLIGVALYIQSRLEDSPAFLKLKAHKAARESLADPRGSPAPASRSPVLLALRYHPRQILLGAGAIIAIHTNFYILIAFVVAYGSGAGGLGIDRASMLAAVLVGAVAMVPAVFLSALYSDRHGRRGVYITGAVLLGLWSFALFPLLQTGNFVLICVAIAVGQACVGMMYGPQAAFFSELFSTGVRYSGASLGYQIGSILGGGIAPLVATGLLASTGTPLAIAAYMASACAVTIVSVLRLDETYRSDLHATVAGTADEAAARRAGLPAVAAEP